MTEENYLPYARQSISKEDLDAVQSALQQPMITRGTLVEEFEKALAEYTGAPYAVAFNTGTAALMAAYFAADVDHHDQVYTSPNTFIATIGPAIQRMATPVFVDIEKETGNIDLKLLLSSINQPKSRGKTVIAPVHFAGSAVDVQAINDAISDPASLIIEDACHAIGSHYKDGTKVGSCAFSDMTVFSFHPAKTITTAEGGAVTAKDKQIYQKLKAFRNNGIVNEAHLMQQEPAPWCYEVQSLTGNYNFTELQAALGLSQLKRIDTFIQQRQKLLDLYRHLLEGEDAIRMLTPSPHLESAPHLAVVRIPFKKLKTSRTKFMQALKERGIGSQYHYIPLYRHPVFSNTLGDLSPYFPEMERYFEEGLSLPLYADLKEKDVERVVKAVKTLIHA